jgi:hypothetical protein
VILYGHSADAARGSVGAAIEERIRKRKLHPAIRAWDLLSIALAVVSSDIAGHRDRSPDGWTREFHVTIAVMDDEFWTSQADTLQSLLQFLTTDRWQLAFVPGGAQPPKPPQAIYPENDCVTLLSGGLDSFIGAVDLIASGTSSSITTRNRPIQRILRRNEVDRLRSLHMASWPPRRSRGITTAAPSPFLYAKTDSLR